MTQQPIPNQHDGFFKATFSRLEVVQLALNHFLSPDVLGSLKLETLELDKANGRIEFTIARKPREGEAPAEPSGSAGA